MIYNQVDFIPQLKVEIIKKEQELKKLLEKVLHEFQNTSDQIKIEGSFDQDGEDPFQPGYASSISIGLLDETDELTDLHTIKIWECERTFLGVPVTRNIPGSKVKGELLDESVKEVKEEVRDFIKEFIPNVMR
ncbi:hypothetical protein AWM68_02215 [Fictibacillus phosphorivorans]|uniref:Uncharacterized protein n=1 Tax=Fictibacillus phosphorivorans TaxID=1221500 RepID=A0A161TRS8_9BACL|nr:hypothetical protein [Fictibacillus phosphorivorans]KZE69101.1 hypothetical protein AWM68_02215 [Fictibacillus phosphorivorans]